MQEIHRRHHHSDFVMNEIVESCLYVMPNSRQYLAITHIDTEQKPKSYKIKLRHTQPKFGSREKDS